MRWRRIVLALVVPLVVAGAGTLLTIASNVATGGSSPWFPAVERHPLWWTVGATAAVAGAAVLAGWSQRLADRELAALIPPVQRPERWVVDRPAEVGQIVRALRAPAGITAAVQGAGGFGKTTVAKLVRADRRILRRFGGRVYWVTLGRDVRRDDLVSKVNDLVRQVDPSQAQPFADVQQAADHLAKVLAAGPSRLIVLDDVWFDDQLAAFPVAGRCARLVTTRVPALNAGHTVTAVPVDQMSVVQARAVLLADLPTLPPDVLDGLLAETGRWPLLLRLVNRILRDQVRLRTDSAVVGRELLAALRHDGVAQVDRLTGAAPQRLDVGDPRQRIGAVAATIEASRGLLAPPERARLAELAIFAEDEPVPAALVATLWQATGGIDRLTADAMCARLADLALVTLEPTDADGTVGMHDVLRDFLRGELGPATITDLHRRLLDKLAARLPADPDDPPRTTAAWWRLPEPDGYLWDHLVEHLCAAGATADAEALVTDLRWVAARLERSGPAAPLADLRHVDTPQTIRLRGLLGRAAHLLRATDPPRSCVDVLHSRMADDPDWGPQARMLAARRVGPTLVNDWPLPDLPDPALRRVLIGHTDWVYAMAIAPDGTWLATGGSDKTVLVWDTATWQQRAVLTSHIGKVSAAAVAPDGTWLAIGDHAGTVLIWDTRCWQERRTLYVGRRVNGLAVAPDGTWLAVGAKDRSIRIWNTDRWREQAPLVGRRSLLNQIGSLAVAPDGTWLAAVSSGSTVRIWDVATGTVRAELPGDRSVYGVAVAPDGTWMATVDAASHLRIWDTSSWRELQALRYSSRVNAVAVAPDGTWLAAASEGGDLRLWDTTNWEQRMTLVGSTVMAIAPDGTWLATGEVNRVRIWDTTRPRQRAATDRSRHVSAVAIAPDGTWLA
ncbi:NB-ARC domain-containing protein, partial [Nonomuraea sp. NPDC049784]|uniref:NB-ARC domain-containing protein n=1 Tax=Nonomuraea sp. NPDC049784 TaxID=3154361 RepID=UPI00341111AB